MGVGVGVPPVGSGTHTLCCHWLRRCSRERAIPLFHLRVPAITSLAPPPRKSPRPYHHCNRVTAGHPVCANYPYNCVVGSVRRCDPRRALAALGDSPSEDYRRRICWRYLVGLNLAASGTKNKIGSLARMICGRRCPLIRSETWPEPPVPQCHQGCYDRPNKHSILTKRQHQAAKASHRAHRSASR